MTKRRFTPPTDARAGDQFRAGKRVWSDAEDVELRRRYPDESTTVLAAALRRTVQSVYVRAAAFGLKKSAAYQASPAACRLRRGDHIGAAFRFTKGQTPANKGLRRPGWSPGRMKETQFVKNGTPHTWKPIGHERLVDGYRYRKVNDIRHVPWTRNWKCVHVLLWEQTHGPLPAGHALIFRNGDRTDIRDDNLELLTRRELMARNSVHNLPAPLKQTIQLLGAVNRIIRRRAKDEEQDRRSA